LNFFSFIFSVSIPLFVLINLFFLFYYCVKKKKYLLFFIVSLSVYFFTFNSFFQYNFKKTSSSNKPFTILSYNTRNFNSRNYIPENNISNKIVDFIRNKDADIVCFQEFSAIKYKEFKEYPYIFKTNIITRNKSVQCILSKFPIVNKGLVNFPNTSNNAMFVDILYNKEVIRIYNIHLQSFKVEMNSNWDIDNKHYNIFKKISKTVSMQNEQTEIILNHIKSFSGKIILSGDFNSTQYTLNYKKLKSDRKDTFIEAGFGLGTTYKLFFYPLRLDFILSDNKIKVLSHENFNLKLSDHEPVFAKLALD